MPSSYPIELRLRAVHASDVYGLDRAARLFQVGTASLKRWRRLSREHGSPGRRAMGGDRRGGAATAARLEAAINEKPDRILRELATWFLDTAGRVISISGLCRNLRVARLPPAEQGDACGRARLGALGGSTHPSWSSLTSLGVRLGCNDRTLGDGRAPQCSVGACETAARSRRFSAQCPSAASSR